jgi:hypothetical protein
VKHNESESPLAPKLVEAQEKVSHECVGFSGDFHCLLFHVLYNVLFIAFWVLQKDPNSSKSLGCGYGSIPINTIFSGMNIHKSQLF